MGSPFASRTQKTIELPFDPGQTVTIQALAGRHLEAAHNLMLVENAAQLQRLGGFAVQREIAKIRQDEAEAAKDEAREAVDPVAVVQADPLSQYDRHHVLCRGIVKWSYDVSLATVSTTVAGVTTVSVPAIEDLTEEAAEFLAREILALTLPAQDEAAQKNG